MSHPIPHRISTLIFLKNPEEKFLLLKRKKPPNFGCWSPIGGKLETALGESPHECAARETFEETDHSIDTADLHLFCMITEKNYEGTGHWLLFLFHCLKPIITLPIESSEGRFAFFARSEIDTITLPATDRTVLWSIFDRYHHSFVALRAECTPTSPLKITVEQTIPQLSAT